MKPNDLLLLVLFIVALSLVACGDRPSIQSRANEVFPDFAPAKGSAPSVLDGTWSLPSGHLVSMLSVEKPPVTGPRQEQALYDGRTFAYEVGRTASQAHIIVQFPSWGTPPFGILFITARPDSTEQEIDAIVVEAIPYLDTYLELVESK